jgi:hypothetical protein
MSEENVEIVRRFASSGRRWQAGRPQTVSQKGAADMTKPTKAQIAEARKNLCKDLKMINEVATKEATATAELSVAKESTRVADMAQADAKKWGCSWAQ